MATQQRYECLLQRRNFVFETVFSSQEKLEFLYKAKQAGFFIRLLSHLPAPNHQDGESLYRELSDDRGRCDERVYLQQIWRCHRFQSGRHGTVVQVGYKRQPADWSICWQHFSRVGAPPLRIPSTASRTSKNLLNFLNTYWHPTLILYKLLILSILSLCYILYTGTLTDTILTRIAYLLSLNAILLATILPLLHDYCFEYTFLLLYLLPTSTHS